jgi:flavin reductase (DIM6/NTAB) family NADH-FMN oxidoreductase RutF
MIQETSRVPDLAARFRRAAGFVPTSVAILSTGDVSMTVSSLHCVSFDPPWVSVCLERDSSTGGEIRRAGRFHARVLRADDPSLARGADSAALPLPDLVTMRCTIGSVTPVGDHHLVLASVDDVSVSDGVPLVYWRRGLHGLPRPAYPFMATREAFAVFVEAWEQTTLPRTAWSHAAHVAIGACYAVRFGDAALERTREGILRYNAAVGVENTNTSGYHETLTRFWAAVLQDATRGCADEWQGACHAVERFGEDRDLHTLFYSFDVVRSIDARRGWVAPDTKNAGGPSLGYARDADRHPASHRPRASAAITPGSSHAGYGS